MEDGTYARQILHRLLIDQSWNSSRLEGNTYPLLDTERLISVGEEADNKSATEDIAESDRAKFIEAVEMELLSLHEGNFARFWVRPSEFREWKEVWDE